MSIERDETIHKNSGIMVEDYMYLMTKNNNRIIGSQNLPYSFLISNRNLILKYIEIEFKLEAKVRIE